MTKEERATVRSGRERAPARGAWPGSRSGPLVRGLAATATALVAVGGWLSPSATAAATSAPGAAASAGVGVAGSYIVRAVPGQLPALTEHLQARDVTVLRRLDLIDAVVVQLPTEAAAQLRTDPDVASVTANAGVTLAASDYSPTDDVNSLYSSEVVTGVRPAWTWGYTGAGVDVALIDSGVTPVQGLSETGKILNGPDLTPESQSTDTRYLDTYGHGTHMAGIIAGHDAGVVTRKSEKDGTSFLGVAPDARIISVKAADAHGNSDVSQVIAGIDWVVQHAHDPGINIRVLNLSFGTNSTQPYTVDPLAYAVEVAWRAGIVVVVSAGNNGAGGMTSPATDPYVIAVGADDTRGTRTTRDDIIPSFSSQGLGNRLPDVVAPGVHVQSLRVPGSYIDTLYAGTAAIDDRYFRGSGTSQAAAFVSGAAALLLQAHPAYTPDQIKEQLRNTSTTTHLDGASAEAQGKGMIHVFRAILTWASRNVQSFPRSTGTGSLEAARGDAHLALEGKVLTGEQDIMGSPFDAAAMAADEAAGTSWNGGTWNGKAWAGSSWAGSSWAGSSWAGKAWASGSWTGKAWAGSSWAGSSWAGSSWAGSAWAGRSWASDGWS